MSPVVLVASPLPTAANVPSLPHVAVMVPPLNVMSPHFVPTPHPIPAAPKPPVAETVPPLIVMSPIIHREIRTDL